MLQITENAGYVLEETAITIGKFDGVHRGHRRLLEGVLAEKKQGYRACVISIHANPEPQRSVIYTRAEKQSLCKTLGVDVLAEYTLDAELRALAPEQFVAEVLCRRFNGKVIVVGEDFRFGKNRSGDITLLQCMEKRYGYRTVCVPEVEEDGMRISSTRIRTLLKEGAVEEAGRLLGQPYFLQGEVVHGKQLGRTLGFPTLNVLPGKEKLLPAYGVYVTKTMAAGNSYFGLTNIGVRPTVRDGEAVSAETFLEGYSGDLYGQTVTTEFLHFLRPERRFDSVEKLQRAIREDMDQLKGRTAL